MDSKIRFGTLLVLVFVSEISTRSYQPRLVINHQFTPFIQDEELTELVPYLEKEYTRQIHAMMNAYKADGLSGQMVIETNALIDTKYKTLKRNSDLINSILALPKGISEAGR